MTLGSKIEARQAVRKDRMQGRSPCFLSEARILAPEALKAAVAERARTVLAHYGEDVVAVS